MTQLCVFVSDVTKETRGRNKKTEFPQKSKLTSKTSVCMERGGTLGRLSGPGPRPPRPPRTAPTPGAEGQVGFSMRARAVPRPVPGVVPAGEVTLGQGRGTLPRL